MEGIILYLVVTGIDFKKADIATREQAYLPQSEIDAYLKDIAAREAYSSVFLFTCNRAEIYFSTPRLWDAKKASSLFCERTGISEQDFEVVGYVHRDQDAINHLFEVACGMHSLILGEDQIITQVRQAATCAREHKATDAYLNTVFRHALTCAKRSKTEVDLQYMSPSVVSEALAIMRSKIVDLADKRVLVIGNGEMGRLAASSLIEQGCHVSITKRQHKLKATALLSGCHEVPYDDRYTFLEQADVVVSATRSPHFTLTLKGVQDCKTYPLYFFDLAVPRDIDPDIKQECAISYFGVDDIGHDSSPYDAYQIDQIFDIIADQITKFNEWLDYRTQSRLRVAN